MSCFLCQLLMSSWPKGLLLSRSAVPLLSLQASISRVSGIGSLRKNDRGCYFFEKLRTFAGRRSDSGNIFKGFAEVFFGYFVLIMVN